MRFSETPLPGVWTIELDLIRDGRGWFARTFDAEEFRVRGLELAIAQANTSYNARAGTLRGMHYQANPHGETKLIRCVRGAIFDVAVDLRPDSQTFKRCFGTTLSAEGGLMLYIPVGLAHGFQTLLNDSEVLYQMGHHYVPEAARGVRWNDPAFDIQWPQPPPDGRTISERDRSYEDFTP